MALPKSVRIVLAIAVLVLGLALLLLLLLLSETLLSVQANLQTQPLAVSVAFWSGLLGLGLLVGWAAWRIMMPRRPKTADATEEEVPPPSEDEVRSELEQAIEDGIDVEQARAEFNERLRRRDAGEIHVALYGDISTGKSSLVNALLPEAQAESHVSGGTTRSLERYRWRSPSGDVLWLTDMPGTADLTPEIVALADAESERAHIVVFVVDGDIDRPQHESLQHLLDLRKPLILVLNKSDRYSPDELAQLSERLRGYLSGIGNSAFATVSAATTSVVFRQLPDGSEREETRERPPQVNELANALQRLIDGNQALLDELNDSTTFTLIRQHIDEAKASRRRERAEKLVDGYAVKAAIGALAAVAPGSDLLIQGFLVTQLAKELSATYEATARKVDTELLFKLIQKHVGKAHTLILAVAGNALKAFPGVGTLAGGTLHAVAYALIFRTLGRALIATLESRGEIHPRQTAQLFEEKLGENLERPARELAELVVKRIADTGSSKRDG